MGHSGWLPVLLYRQWRTVGGCQACYIWTMGHSGWVSVLSYRQWGTVGCCQSCYVDSGEQWMGVSPKSPMSKMAHVELTKAVK